jgi:hypothetical protein
MSANNRILIADDGLNWRVWQGSCSAPYLLAPENAETFETKTEAENRAQEIFLSLLVCEGGIQHLTLAEQ